jgi:anti-anti-sigma factor
MHVIEHIHPDMVILEPRDRLTVDNETDLRHLVRHHMGEGRVRLVLDLAHVPYIDSCGLGTIAQTHLATSRAGGWLRLLNVNGRNRQLLTVTRLLDVIGVYEPNRMAISA